MNSLRAKTKSEQQKKQQLRKQILDNSNIVKVYVFQILNAAIDVHCYMALDVDNRKVIFFQQINDLDTDAPELDALDISCNRVLADYLRDHEEFLYKFEQIPTAKVWEIAAKYKTTDDYIDRCSWVACVFNSITEFNKATLNFIYWI